MRKRSLQNMEKEIAGVSETKSLTPAFLLVDPAEHSIRPCPADQEQGFMLFHREADRPQDPWRTVLSE